MTRAEFLRRWLPGGGGRTEEKLVEDLDGLIAAAVEPVRAENRRLQKRWADGYAAAQGERRSDLEELRRRAEENAALVLKADRYEFDREYNAGLVAERDERIRALERERDAARAEEAWLEKSLEAMSTTCATLVEGYTPPRPEGTTPVVTKHEWKRDERSSRLLVGDYRVELAVLKQGAEWGWVVCIGGGSPLAHGSAPSAQEAEAQATAGLRSAVTELAAVASSIDGQPTTIGRIMELERERDEARHERSNCTAAAMALEKERDELRFRLESLSK